MSIAFGLLGAIITGFTIGILMAVILEALVNKVASLFDKK